MRATLWSAADAAFERGQQAYLDWCREIAKLYAEGDATQEEIAGRYDSDQQRISKAVAVGEDQRIFKSNRLELPKSAKVLYLLTTLPDKDFEELCKPTTTQAVILEHKRRLSAPPAPAPVAPAQPQRPPCPGVEGTNNKEWMWFESMNKWVQTIHYEPQKDQEAKPQGVRLTKSARDWVVDYVKFCTEDKITFIMEAIRRLEHPDRGGSNEITVVLNQYLTERK